MVEWGARSGNHGLYMDEVLDLLKELMLLDPYHAAYYESLLSSLFIAKVGNHEPQQELSLLPHMLLSDRCLECHSTLKWIVLYTIYYSFNLCVEINLDGIMFEKILLYWLGEIISPCDVISLCKRNQT